MRKFLLAVGTTLALGCGAKEEAPAAATGPQQVAFHAVDNAFHGPDTITAGVTTFTLENGGQTFHHVQFVRLDSGKTVADLEAALKVKGPPPAWAVDVPGPNAAEPTQKVNATIDIAAGNYALICFVDIPGGVPHFAKGMIKGLVVKPATGPGAAAPTGDVTIAMSDYSFSLSTPVTAGKHTFAVTSTGPQPHEVILIKFQPGKTVEDFGKWIAKPEGPPPGNSKGGTSGQRPGTTATFEADITPGDYAIICLVPDAKDGKPHAEHGMVLPFKVQ
jgi:uncharacterized cupredoxin-like copper-binding protein